MKTKKKTSNAQRPTPNIEWSPDGRVREEPHGYVALAKIDSMLNAQRSTPNPQRQSEPRFDLEDRLLEFSARIIRLVDALPNTRAANHLAGQLLRSGTSPYGNNETEELIRIFFSSIRTAEKNSK
jgi:hypothetical protein